ncbi:hypothetical protein BJX70DRAFT_382453 [Aspergillus crustosus]
MCFLSLPLVTCFSLFVWNLSRPTYGLWFLCLSRASLLYQGRYYDLRDMGCLFLCRAIVPPALAAAYFFDAVLVGLLSSIFVHRLSVRSFSSGGSCISVSLTDLRHI